MELFVVQKKHYKAERADDVEIYGIHLTKCGAEMRVEELEKRLTTDDVYFVIEEWRADQ
jgi:hypothetical protein